MAHIQAFTSEHCRREQLKQARTAGGCNSERKAEEWHTASLQMREQPGCEETWGKVASASPDGVVRVLSIGPPLSASQRFPREQLQRPLWACMDEWIFTALPKGKMPSRSRGVELKGTSLPGQLWVQTIDRLQSSLPLHCKNQGQVSG